MKLLLPIEPESQEPDETFDMDACDPGFEDSGSDVTPSGGTKRTVIPTTPCRRDSKNPSSGQKSNEKKAVDPTESAVVDALLVEACTLYDRAKQSEAELLMERITIGEILIQLKTKVGHGNFLKKFEEWQDAKKINFSLKTGEMAMHYAELANAGKLESVSNLAEAGRIRKAEAIRKKAERNAAKAAEDNGTGEPEPLPQAKLDRAKALQKAKHLAKPALNECRCYEVETRIVVLEELIELLSEELEKITEGSEP